MKRLILASASQVRVRLLGAAGVEFRIEPAEIDEAEFKRNGRAGQTTPQDCALSLAEAKALRVSSRDPEALVVGADQILECGGTWFDKPTDISAAQLQLQALRGRTHLLATAACVVCGGERRWQHVSSPRLTVRNFSDEFLDAYLAAEGEAVLGSVGAYRLEAGGVQLFERISGDHFAILGLPLVELLKFLREADAVLS